MNPTMTRTIAHLVFLLLGHRDDTGAVGPGTVVSHGGVELDTGHQDHRHRKDEAR